MKRAFVFPGKGSHKVRTGRSLKRAFPAGRELHDEVDDAFAQPFEGPKNELGLKALGRRR